MQIVLSNDVQKIITAYPYQVFKNLSEKNGNQVSLIIKE